MNGLDIGARALAIRALSSTEEPVDHDEGAANLRERSEPTAAELEALAEAHGLLTGYAGDVHTVETTPYPIRNGLVIRGNGAELRNVNPTNVATDHLPLAALSLGISTVWATPRLTYYAVLSASGPELSVAVGEGDNFAPGDLVIVHGVTQYSGTDYDVYRNYVRAQVVAATSDTITLDRALPGELLADGPKIGNVEEGIEPSFSGPERFYLIHRPHISNLVLSSLEGETWKWGGVIDGTFRDITSIGRNGISFNAMQDCLFENIHFQSWRKICELAEGSVGTTIRTVRGSLADGSTKAGGQSDVPGAFISMNENCAECVFEDFNVSSGPNDAGGNACQMRQGRNNVVRNSILRFPAHTGNGLLLKSHGEAGNPNKDCGFENLQVFLPVCSSFFTVSDAGAGVVRPFFRNVKFFGSASSRAGTITGEEGVLENVWCEDGALLLQPSCMNWRVESCYFSAGFDGLTQALLNTNVLRDNESDASRRIAAAAIVEKAQTTIGSAVANNLVHTMTIAPGDLKLLDEVHFRLAGSTSGGGINTRHVRVTARIDGTTDTEIAHLTIPANFASWALEGAIDVHANTIIHCTAKQITESATTVIDTRTGAGNLDVHGLTLKVELWTDGSGNVVTRLVKIAGQKAGMRNVSVFG